ncbi:MAG TPA: NUDIX hydrolase [Solirubrobacteraceae bacterium]
MSPTGGFQALGGESVFSGRLLDVRLERFRHADGEEVSREIVHHQGAVGILAHDNEQLWLVRQPREAVDEAELLEIPAGRLDVAQEAPLDCAKRELAEEIGLGAKRWQPILDYYSSPGFTDELVHLFLATELFPASAVSEENERIEIVSWPLERLAEAIDACRDAKTLIALLWLTGRLKS